MMGLVLSSVTTNVGDFDTYYVQEYMDHSIFYSQCYASDSNGDGPVEQIDEEGFKAKEAKKIQEGIVL
jgi:hypothetical protein